MSGISPSLRHFFPPAVFGKAKNQYYRAQKLPLPYQKFFNEWKDEASATPVHWTPRPEKWERNPETGEVKPVQNCPIPVKYPHQINQGIWGGEGVIQGLVKKGRFKKPVTKFWMPNLQRNVVYSEILNKYLSMMVTERALRLIDHHNGLDFYLLQSPANDLKGLLPLKLKRRLYLALLDKDFAHDDPKKQEEIYNKYKQYMVPREEADWYGLALREAEAKWELIQKSENISKIAPLKLQYRMEYLQKLTEEASKPPEPEPQVPWTTKLNPFSKPAEVPPTKEPLY